MHSKYMGENVRVINAMFNDICTDCRKGLKKGDRIIRAWNQSYCMDCEQGLIDSIRRTNQTANA